VETCTCIGIKRKEKKEGRGRAPAPGRICIQRYSDPARDEKTRKGVHTEHSVQSVLLACLLASCKLCALCSSACVYWGIRIRIRSLRLRTPPAPWP